MYQDLNTPHIVASSIPYVLGSVDVFCTFLKADSLYNKSFYTLPKTKKIINFSAQGWTQDIHIHMFCVYRLREPTFE